VQRFVEQVQDFPSTGISNFNSISRGAVIVFLAVAEARVIKNELASACPLTQGLMRREPFAAKSWRQAPAPDCGQPTPKPATRDLRAERQRYFHCAFLICLKGDLLGQHDVAHSEGEAAVGHEAPAADEVAIAIQLINVAQASNVDAVALAGFGTDYFEVPIPLELGELLRGEPFPEEDPRFGLGTEALSRLCSSCGANGHTRVTFARPRLSGVGGNLLNAEQSLQRL
jgi:hypothetical protein